MGSQKAKDSQPRLGFDADEVKPADDGQMASPLLSTALIERNEVALLALSTIPGVGFYTLRNLFNHYRGELFQVWEENGEELFEILRQMRTPQPADVVQRIQKEKRSLLETASEQCRFLRNRRHTTILFRYTPSYPARLEKLKDAPAWLFVHGDPALLHDEKIVAVVGTRVPTENGIETARKLSGELIKERCVILSGLAEGIDEASHRTAVDFGAPTIAVLGHGLDVTFPAKTAGLRREIVEGGGTVVSEYLIGDSYGREKFIQRNRLQAALSRAVAVVEAKSKSGTAHTVKFARSLDVTLFGVVQGSISAHPIHELLRDLEEAGDSVFDIGSQVGVGALHLFFRQLFAGVRESTRQFDPQLFNGIWTEIRRISEEYKPSTADYEWLISKIDGLRKRGPDDVR